MKVLTLLCLLSFSLVNAAGFDGDTKEVKILKVGDKILFCEAIAEECSINNSEEDAISYDRDMTSFDVKTLKLGGFLLTGVIVHQTSRAIGYIGVFASAGAVLASSVAGGPGAMGAAYLGVLNAVGPALATVETGSLILGTAASFIPLLP
jgi:hypothetical protein